MTKILYNLNGNMRYNILLACLVFSMTTLYGQDNVHIKSSHVYLNILKAKSDIGHSRRLLEQMKNNRGVRLAVNVDRITKDLNHATVVLQTLYSTSDQLISDLSYEGSCVEEFIENPKQYRMPYRSLADNLIGIQSYVIGLNFSFRSDKAFMQLYEAINRKFESFDKNFEVIQNLHHSIFQVVLNCQTKASVFSCNEITKLLDSAGEIVNFVENDYINSAWFNGLVIYRYYDDYFVLVILNEQAYIFCDVPEVLTNRVLPSFKRAADFERFYHDDLKEYSCMCG